MLREQTYSAANRCLTRIKRSNLDQLLKVRLECHFIKLKRHILSSDSPIPMEEIATLDNLFEDVVRSPDKAAPVVVLEEKIREIINVSQSEPHP